MGRTILIWAAVLAVGALMVQGLRYAALAQLVSTPLYVVAIGAAFAIGGVLAGWRLARRATPSAVFEPNLAAQASLGLTRQEMRVLGQLAAGASNKEIARTLGVSPNTVKTHVSSLFGKLEVGRRTQAIGKARELRLIP